MLAPPVSGYTSATLEPKSQHTSKIQKEKTDFIKNEPHVRYDSENAKNRRDRNISDESIEEDNRTLPPAPIPPRNGTKNATDNGSGVHSYNLRTNQTDRESQNNTTLFRTGSTNNSTRYAGADFGAATVNNSGENEANLQPKDASTAPDGVRNLIRNTQKYPWSGIVLLRIDADGNGIYDYFCSGSLVDDNHVLTAGHCAYLYGEQGNSIGWAKDIVVIPGANSPDQYKQPFGIAKVEYAQTYSEWSNNRDYRYDMALLTLDRDIGDLTGGFGYTTADANSSVYRTSAHATGFPAVPPSNSIPSLTMWDHVDSGAGVTYCRVSQSCLGHEYWMITTAGQSGGPVWQYRELNNSTDGAYILSIISHGFISPNRPNVGTRITHDRFDDLGSWIKRGNEIIKVDNRPELAVLDPIESDNIDVKGYSPSTITAGNDILKLRQVVKNKGPKTTGCFAVSFRVSSDSEITADDPELANATVCSLAPNQRVTVSANVSVDRPSGDYYVGVIVDPDDEINEYDLYENVQIYDEQLTIEQGKRESIHGLVYDENGTPIEEAEIKAVNLDTGETVARTETGSEGEYTIEVAANNEYQIEATADGYDRSSAIVNVSKNKTSSANLVLTEISEAGLPTKPGEPDFVDVLQVIDAYNTGRTYNGVQVEFIDVLEVIAAYNAG
ncbi:carboxypeptidase regulatory-like domain-containing protein [Haloplanus rubicundus]|uniref:carboxypeptidase regulatory-like domain-containing protein n=1 Tax=Haloplanus rubicundus TaxID=1547898 RepID=UPI0016510F2E|nr:carboxypeptidase regulatory-like domain-containing protein [Haloplanus rubicundus]